MRENCWRLHPWICRQPFRDVRCPSPARGCLQLVWREEGRPRKHQRPVRWLQCSLDRRCNHFDLGALLACCLSRDINLLLHLRLALLFAMLHCTMRWYSGSKYRHSASRLLLPHSHNSLSLCYRFSSLPLAPRGPVLARCRKVWLRAPFRLTPPWSKVLP